MYFGLSDMPKKKRESKWVKLFARSFLRAAHRFDSAITQLDVTALAVYNDNFEGAEIFSTRSLEYRGPPY